MKKTYDAVAAMREARQKIADEWGDKPREQEIQHLHRKYTNITGKKKHAKS